MLTTDAYAYLDVQSPVCAWCVYRGVLVAANMHDQPGFISVWSASLLRNSEPQRLRREFTLEIARQVHFPNLVSRLSGMYCFVDIDSARRAASSWRGHFELENLVELHLDGPRSSQKFDANWIRDDLSDPTWQNRYWQGDPCPDAEPIWEMVFDGRMIVLGTTVREKAYQVVKREFPNSLGILEIARQAAWVDSDLGDICHWAHEEGDALYVEYLLNMRDADDPNFLDRLGALHKNGHEINWTDLGPHLEAGSFGNVPDLRHLNFSILKPNNVNFRMAHRRARAG